MKKSVKLILQGSIQNDNKTRILPEETEDSTWSEETPEKGPQLNYRSP